MQNNNNIQSEREFTPPPFLERQDLLPCERPWNLSDEEEEMIIVPTMAHINVNLD